MLLNQKIRVQKRKSNCNYAIEKIAGQIFRTLEYRKQDNIVIALSSHLPQTKALVRALILRAWVMIVINEVKTEKGRGQNKGQRAQPNQQQASQRTRVHPLAIVSRMLTTNCSKEISKILIRLQSGFKGDVFRHTVEEKNERQLRVQNATGN